jgi:hypothetical protein
MYSKSYIFKRIKIINNLGSRKCTEDRDFSTYCKHCGRRLYIEERDFSQGISTRVSIVDTNHIIFILLWITGPTMASWFLMTKWAYCPLSSPTSTTVALNLSFPPTSKDE